MHASSAISAVIKSQSDLLTPQQVFKEYLIPVSTQRVWKCMNRFGWRDIAIKLGHKTVYRRGALEEWLSARTGKSE